MRKSLITDEMNNKINEISQACFNGNSLIDNIVYNLDIIFNMPTTQDIIHHSLAHQLPLIADKFADIQTFQNSKPSRLSVQENTKVYTSFVDCFKDISNYFNNQLIPKIKECILFSEEDGDITTKIMLENELVSLNIFVKQSIIWEQKAIDYDNFSTSMEFDKDFESFTIIPII